MTSRHQWNLNFANWKRRHSLLVGLVMLMSACPKKSALEPAETTAPSAPVPVTQPQNPVVTPPLVVNPTPPVSSEKAFVFNNDLSICLSQNYEIGYNPDEVVLGQDSSCSNFNGQRIENQTFTGYDFSGSDFSNATLENVHFENSNLQAANFEGAQLLNVTFSNVNTEDASFQNSVPVDTILPEIRQLVVADFSINQVNDLVTIVNSDLAAESELQSTTEEISQLTAEGILSFIAQTNSAFETQVGLIEQDYQNLETSITGDDEETAIANEEQAEEIISEFNAQQIEIETEIQNLQNTSLALIHEIDLLRIPFEQLNSEILELNSQMLQVSSAISSAQIEYSELTARLRDLRRQVIAEDNEEARETLRREFASAKNRQGDIEAQYLVQKRQIAQFIEVIETKQDLAAEYQSRAQAQVASLQIRQTDLRDLKERFVSVKARNSAIARVKNRVVTKKNEIRNRRNIASDNGNNGNSGNSNSNSNSNSN